MGKPLEDVVDPSVENSVPLDVRPLLVPRDSEGIRAPRRNDRGVVSPIFRGACAVLVVDAMGAEMELGAISRRFTITLRSGGQEY